MTEERKGLPEGTTAERYMEHYLPRALNRNAALLGDTDCVLHFVLTGPGGGDWTLVVKNGAARTARGRDGAARCTFTVSADDWMELVQGRLSGPVAFMTGRFQVEGDYFYAMKLGRMILAALQAKSGRSASS